MRLHSFIGRVLGPLPPGAIPVAEPAFLRIVAGAARDAWHLRRTRVEVALLHARAADIEAGVRRVHRLAGASDRHEVLAVSALIDAIEAALALPAISAAHARNKAVQLRRWQRRAGGLAYLAMDVRRDAWEAIVEDDVARFAK